MDQIKGRVLRQLVTCVVVLSTAVSTKHSQGEIVYRKDDRQVILAYSGEKKQPILKEGLSVDRVIQNAEGEFLVLKKNSEQPYQEGMILDIQRYTKGRAVRTGEAKVTSSQGAYLIAAVRKGFTPESQLLLENYPSIMAGDLAFPKRYVISRTIQVSPSKTLSYMSLFRDPYAYPKTYELTDEGRQALERVAEVFRHSKLPKLIIEAHTDAEGPADTNQIESYQRALTIRQYLVGKLEFDPNRVIAIGMGEIEPLEEPYLPEHKRNARRIVMKVKSN